MSKFSETGVIIRESVAGSGLGALGAKAAIGLGTLQSGMTEDFRILKSKIVAWVVGLTAGQGEGLCLGIQNGELSAAEVAECLVANGPTDRNDRLLVERAGRYCEIFGDFVWMDPASVSMRLQGPEGGQPVTIKPRWTFNDPEAWDLFVFNAGGALTTGALLQLQATHYGVWLD